MLISTMSILEIYYTSFPSSYAYDYWCSSVPRVDSDRWSYSQTEIHHEEEYSLAVCTCRFSSQTSMLRCLRSKLTEFCLTWIFCLQESLWPIGEKHSSARSQICWMNFTMKITDLRVHAPTACTYMLPLLCCMPFEWSWIPLLDEFASYTTDAMLDGKWLERALSYCMMLDLKEMN